MKFNFFRIPSMVVVGFIGFMLLTGASEQKRPEWAATVDHYFDHLYKNSAFMGTVLVSKAGTVIYQKSWGYQDIAAGRHHEIDQPTMVASVTKSFTAAAIITLLEDGRITLEDTVSKYVPDFPKGDILTISALLNEQSGLDDPDWMGELYTEMTLSGLVEHIATRPFKFEPFQGSAYSNSAYILLAYIIESVSGMSYDAYLRTVFFDPLNMTHTFDFSSLAGENIKVDAYLPAPAPNMLRSGPPENYSLSTGAGSLVTTARDLAKWGHGVIGHAVHDPFFIGYPYGWGRDYIDEEVYLNQSGAKERGYKSYIGVFPSEDLVVVVLDNVDSNKWPKWGVDLLEMARGKSVELPGFPKETKWSERKMAKLAGRYTSPDTKRFWDIHYYDDNLWLSLEGHAVHRLLTPTSETGMYLRDFFGKLEFQRFTDSSAQSFLFLPPEDWNENIIEYSRELRQ